MVGQSRETAGKSACQRWLQTPRTLGTDLAVLGQVLEAVPELGIQERRDGFLRTLRFVGFQVRWMHLSQADSHTRVRTHTSCAMIV